MPNKYIIPNLANACRVLKFLGRSDTGFTATEITRKLTIPQTTTLRIITTLEREGMARREDGKIFLGPLLIHLGLKAMDDTELRELSQPILQDLSRETHETAHVAILCEDHPLIVAVCDSPHPLRSASKPGTLTELYSSALGKVFLCSVLKPRIAELVEKYPPTQLTPKSRITLKEIEEETERTAKQGYGFDDEEFNPGVRCLAAPVIGPKGEVVAAMGITASTIRFTTERTAEMAEKVLAAANNLSRMIGFR